MLTGMKILAVGILTLVAFYAILFAFFSSLLCGRGAIAGIIFYGGILGFLFGIAALLGHAFGL